MAAVSILIKGARGVSQSYDYIQELFNDIGPILSRLQIHARKDLPVELKQLYIDILACVLEIIGVSTNRASELKVKLQTLVGQESTLVGALNLEATGSILETTKLTGKIISKLDSKIEDLANSVNQIPKQPKGNRPKNSDNNSRNEMLKKLRERMLPQLNLEDDLLNLKYLAALSDPMYRQLVENTCQGIEDIGTLASVEFCMERNQGHGSVNILIVGRWDIDWYVEEVFETQVPCVDILPGKNNEDINKYISHILAKSRNLKKTSPELQSEILSVLTSEADGMFLWADLMLKEISTKNREALIRESLQSLPRGLPDTYERMFHVFSEALIDEPDQIKDLNELLLWVGFASRPLSLAELEVILELRYGDGGD
ncbi:hypothetical protein TWF788_006775 [Orbilia oligospora]|uniref:Fungal STAND N-terminal Goodbye domain-containing protein n=1 Tax=Orbilia oligospora TaxID=2813651 RepID=A0A7C8TTT8_ORBOL|nr:hypothetical protein TWF788_006775 [Orbilia oligospora]